MGASLALKNRRKGKGALRPARFKRPPFGNDILNEIFHQGKSLPLARHGAVMAEAHPIAQPQEPICLTKIRSHLRLEGDEGRPSSRIELPLVEKLRDDAIVSSARPRSLLYVGKATVNLPQDVLDAFESHDLLVDLNVRLVDRILRS